MISEERFEVDESLIVTPHTETGRPQSEIERPMSAAFSAFSDCDTNRPLPALPLADNAQPPAHQAEAEVKSIANSSPSSSKALAIGGSSPPTSKIVANSSSAAIASLESTVGMSPAPGQPSTADYPEMDAPPQYDPRWSPEHNLPSSSSNV